MKNFLLAFIVFLVYSIFGMWYYACIIKGLCAENTTTNPIVQDTIDPPEVDQVITKPIIDNLSSDSFAIRDIDGNAIFSFADNISITNNSNSINIPNSSGSFKDSIFSFLNKNQDKELVITGLRSSTENENMGLNRANQIKSDLEKFGVNADRISVEEEVKEFAFDANGTMLGGINFTFKNLSEARLSKIESGIANKILYSGFASKGFKPDNTLRAYALELKNYLEKYPNKLATITGHTDPIDTNNTLEGRRKNRRIEIDIN